MSATRARHRARPFRGMRPLAGLVAAAVGLAGLAASAVLLGSPVGASTGLTVRACLDDNSKVVAKLSSADGGTYFAALVGANHTTNTVPTSADVSSATVTVKLDGDFFAGDTVQVTDSSGSVVANSSIALSCGDNVPQLQVNWSDIVADQDSGNCQSQGDKASIGVTLQSKTDPNTASYRRATGLSTVPYTLAVLNPDQTVADVQNSSADYYNDTVTGCVTVTVTKPTAVQVKAVSIDGVVKTAALTVSPQASSNSPSKPHPTPTPTHSASNPNPGHGGSSSGGSSTHADQPSTAAPSNNPGGSGSVVVAPPANGGGGSTGGSGSTGNGTGSSSSTHASSTAARPSASPSSSPGIDSSAQFGTSGTRIIADPPMSDSSHLFVWQKDAALIVLVDALAIGALVGGVVLTARRR